METQRARIVQSTKSAMQSGRGAAKWIIEFPDSAQARSIDAVMGWTSSRDMGREVKLEFPNLESAENFAKSNSWDYEVIQPLQARLIKKSYADNFK
jgi:uncharacterized protein (DUF1330 family)